MRFGGNAMAEFDKLSIEDALKQLQTSKEKGLSSEDAKKRLSENGYNVIEEKKETDKKSCGAGNRQIR